MEHNMMQCQQIPNRIILKNNHHAHRKILINKKFQWLNKYLCAASPKLINPEKMVSFSQIQPELIQKKNNKQLITKQKVRQICKHTQSQILKAKRCLYKPQHRKTNSTYLSAQGKSKENKAYIFKTVQGKRQKQNLTPHKKLSVSELKGKIRPLWSSPDEFQIQPWNYEQNEDADILKLNKNRLNTHF